VGTGRGPTAEELAELVAEHLDRRRLAVAESCTAGRVATALASVPGATEWFRGGVVAYQPVIKSAVLGVQARPVVSERAAEEMARGVARVLGAEVAVATTGVAGDEPDDGVPPGTVVIATLVAGEVQVATHHIEGEAPVVCAEGTRRALEALVAHLRVPATEGISR
jgi:PncC family amidohydrolase